MAGQPQWKRVLISGSNFEVNSLTSSGNFPLVNFPDATAKFIVFRDPVTGGWETTSSMRFVREGTTDYLDLGGNDGNNASHSLNSPDNSISASVVRPISSSEVTADLLNWPAVFRNDTYGGFEHTESIVYSPVLEFAGFQSGGFNDTIRTGSTLEGGIGLAPINSMQGQTEDRVPLTFTSSVSNHFTSQSEITYLDTSNGDYMEWKRGMPIGTGVTASFDIPFFFNGSFTGKEIKAVIRRWLPGQYAVDEPFEETSEIVVDDLVFRDMNGWDQNTPLPVSASFSGSFEIESTSDLPIRQGERWQLRIRANQAYGIGYSSTNAGYVGGYQLKITGSTASVGPVFYAPNFTGSFSGNAYGGGYSGSITGISLNDIPNSKALRRGDGIIFVDAAGTPQVYYKGTTETTASIRLYPQGTNGVSSGNENKSFTGAMCSRM